MFKFFGTKAEAATQSAKAAQEQTALQNLKLIPVNDDIAEDKYHHKYFGRDDAEDVTG